MKTLRFLICVSAILVNGYANGQALRDINFNYQYGHGGALSFDIKPVRLTDRWTIFYRLQMPDTAYTADQFSIQWEKRNELSEKEGTPLSNEETQLSVLNSTKQKVTGSFTVGISQNRQILVAKVLNNVKKQMWLFLIILEPNYPVNGYLQSNEGEIIFEPYINIGQSVSVKGFGDGQSLYVSYYDDVFPTAAPAFSEGLAKVNKGIQADSAFAMTSAQVLTLPKKGLYLIQKDTTQVEGIAFRVEEDYPKFKRLPDLVGPFMYVCSKIEYDKLRTSGNDKKQFDRGVLAITHDPDRAKDFMKNYFRRAEAANRYFTSYKEGWKTDRGMVYLIYGEPQTVFKFFDREVWSYGKTSFTFIKSSTLFDPDNFVLVRNRKYTEEWYERVDLLRNARF